MYNGKERDCITMKSSKMYHYDYHKNYLLTISMHEQVNKLCTTEVTKKILNFFEC